MKEKEISGILLVRSVEEEDPSFFSSEIQLEALRTAGDAENEITLIQKRGRFLFDKLPDRIKALAETVQVPDKWFVLLCAAVFLLGIVFNYLGPGDTIHVLYNPVVLLIVWNIAVFACSVAGHFFLKREQHSQAPLTSPGKHSAESGKPESVVKSSMTPDSGYTSPGSRWLFKRVWFSLHRQAAKRRQDVKRAAASFRITGRYLELWWAMMHSLLITRIAGAFHVLALCLVTGALAGTYMRGLFFEYNVVWKSTFIHEPGVIASLLNSIFGLPSKMLNGTFVQESGIVSLMDPGGQPAAPWIHLFAVSVFLYVVPQRLLMMYLASRKGKALREKITIDTGEDYYARLIRLAREMQSSRLQDEISSAVRAEIESLSEAIAGYARDGFYNNHVVPQLMHFRDRGGRISDLENAISQESDNFRDELERFLENAQDDFKKSLSQGVSRIIGKKLTKLELSLGEGIHVKPETYHEALDGTVTRKMTDGISVAVTAAVAATVGTISGGFGKVLGIAVISTLLHTTGPVGFVIGALAGLLLGGGASVLARDRITDAVKKQKFPAFSTQLILRESKMSQTVEQGREQVYSLIKNQIGEKLAPYAEEITKRILSRIAVPDAEEEKDGRMTGHAD